MTLGLMNLALPMEDDMLNLLLQSRIMTIRLRSSVSTDVDCLFILSRTETANASRIILLGVREVLGRTVSTEVRE